MRTITIKSKGLGRYDDVSPFLVESGALDLKINLPNLSGEFFFVSELNGKSGGAKSIPREGTITLTGLEAGELHAEVKHYLRGELIETYKVEPLLLKAVDTQLSATPEIAFLMGECKTLREKLEAAETALAEAKTRSDKVENGIEVILEAFLAFAYADYQTNLQLNAKSLSIEQFILALGFSTDGFSEEELVILEKFKEVL